MDRQDRVDGTDGRQRVGVGGPVEPDHGHGQATVAHRPEVKNLRSPA